MASFLFFFFVVLIALAAFFRADFILIILYLLVGLYVISHWWSRHALAALQIKRSLPERAFWGEIIPVRVNVKNEGYLPVVWVHLRETLPMELSAEGITQEVVNFGSHAIYDLKYELDCRKRGYYPIGPLTLFSGDLFGISQQQPLIADADHLTVFPKIIPLANLELPVHSPLGTIRHTQPIFEDPARVRGKRDYITGDSFRQVDWKASAVAQRLQVKLYEPSIALETMVFLNLNRLEYNIKDLYRASELGIITAASIANWITRKRQAVGLATNGIDPMVDNKPPMMISSKRGQGHLMRILEVLARIENADSYPLVQLIEQDTVHLSWGTTLIVIANQAGDDLFDAFFQIRRKGINPILILCGFVDQIVTIQRKAAYFNYPTYHFLTEKDLDVWRH